MNDENTLTTPFTFDIATDRVLLCFTIVWHPDKSLIGSQYYSAEKKIEISRSHPEFHFGTSYKSPLSSQTISRQPLRIKRDTDNNLIIHAQQGKMSAILNGSPLNETQYLDSSQVTEGIMLFLGGSVILSINWAYMLSNADLVPSFVGVSQAASKVRKLLQYAASNLDHVLLLGETGTGKEVAAEAIHSMSGRRSKNMLAVNMSSLSDALAAAELFGSTKGAYTGAATTRAGFFAQAAGTTLFLDEIGNTPSAVQPMLLRVLEKGDFYPIGSQQACLSQARIIAATDQNLNGNGFNPALLRRLEQLIISLPPLRERREDIGLLIRHIVKIDPSIEVLINSLPASLIYEFCNFSWPGNIRQLNHVLRRALQNIYLGETPTMNSLIDNIQKNLSNDTIKITNDFEKNDEKRLAPKSRASLSDFTKEKILSTLQENDWNLKISAESLGISRPSIYQLIKLHNLQRSETNTENITDTKVDLILVK